MELSIDKPVRIVVQPFSTEGTLLRRLLKKIRRFQKGEAPVYLDSYFVHSTFGKSAYVNSLYGGGKIQIGNNCLILGGINIESPGGNVTIGENTFIGGGASLNSMCGITIGKNVLVAGNSVIQDHNSHSLNYDERRNDINLAIARFKGVPNFNKDFSVINSKEVFIGDDAWIGQNCIILKGVRIGNRSIIGAGSVVTKDVPDDSVAGGNPAKIIKTLV